MKWEIKKIKEWKYYEHPQGATILEAGNSLSYQTGSWRTFRPRWLEEKCTHCLYCFIYCPDAAVKVSKEKFAGFDYEHCKGCGICAAECPREAIEMIEEREADGN